MKTPAPQWDELDKAILNYIQHEFPLTPRPYKELAEWVGSSENEVFDRVKVMIESGHIRRLGGVFDTNKLGFYSTLVALKVAEDKIDQVAEEINNYHGVTHNYKRDHEWNLWFTFSGDDKMAVEETLAEIERIPGVKQLMELPAQKKYKLGLKLPIQ